MFYWTDFYINKICLWRHDQPVKVIEKDTAEKFIWLYHIRSDHKLHGQLLPVRDGRDGSCKRIWFWFLNLSFLYFINKLPNITFGGQRLNMSMFFLLLCLFQNPNVSKVKYSERIESFFFFLCSTFFSFSFFKTRSGLATGTICLTKVLTWFNVSKQRSIITKFLSDFIRHDHFTLWKKIKTDIQYLWTLSSIKCFPLHRTPS